MSVVLTQSQKQFVSRRGGVILFRGGSQCGKTYAVALRTLLLCIERPGEYLVASGRVAVSMAQAELVCRMATALHYSINLGDLRDVRVGPSHVQFRGKPLANGKALVRGIELDGIIIDDGHSIPVSVMEEFEAAVARKNGDLAMTYPAITAKERHRMPAKREWIKDVCNRRSDVFHIDAALFEQNVFMPDYLAPLLEPGVAS